MPRVALVAAALAFCAGLVVTANDAVRPRAPHLLSQTGLYAEPLRIDSRNRSFSPQYPLWSDGAAKSRWVYLPEGATIDVRDVDAWSFPVGTKFWKEFSFAGRRVETRMLWKVHTADWVFASYVWNPEGTDAVLAPEEGLTGVAEVATGRRHTIPSIEDCRACHDSGRTEVLGFSALQLSTDRDPHAIHGEPMQPEMMSLRTLADEGRLAPGRPELVTWPPRIEAPDAATRTVLGYLSTNCGACHNRASELAPLGLDFKQHAYPSPGPNAVVRSALARITKWDLPGTVPGTSRALVPGAPDHSALVVRMRSRRPSSQMPPLGTVLQDHGAIGAVEQWVRSMANTLAVEAAGQ